MSTRRIHQILQIIPANRNWKAVYANPDGTVFEDEIACWAIVYEKESVGESYSVQGIIGGEWMDTPDEDQNFLGYRAPAQPIGPFLEQAKNRAESVKESKRP